MTGRGIDQILPHPGGPHLREPFLRSALQYVKLAERESGPIPRPADYDYVWGDALAELRRAEPDVRIGNLETTVTSSGEYAPDRVIHYRMHPLNLPCLTRAGFDCLVLANNHMMDFGRAGLTETLEVLHRARIATAGAGRDETEAGGPAIISVAGQGRVLVFAWGMASSGVYHDMSGGANRPGVNVLSDLSRASVDAVAREIEAVRQPGDIVIASLHWGPNWGFKVPREERTFAHDLIDVAGVDVVYGHSSHHIKGIEVYRDRPIFYGCGDFLNDYEGIAGYEEFRGDLSLMYFPRLDPGTGRLNELRMVPTQVYRFRIGYAPREGAEWLEATLNREGRELGTRVERMSDGSLQLEWT